jgi:hypothetical protein
MSKRPQLVEVRPTTEADRTQAWGDVHPPFVAICSNGYRFFADTEDQARQMFEDYYHPPRRGH